jgi:hypothetical protein
LKPRPPSSLDEATVADHDLEDEATYRRLGFFDIDLSGRSADSVEFEQCSHGCSIQTRASGESWRTVP